MGNDFMELGYGAYGLSMAEHGMKGMKRETRWDEKRCWREGEMSRSTLFSMY